MTSMKNGFDSGLAVGTALTVANSAYAGNDAVGAVQGVPKQGPAGLHGSGSLDISAGVTAAQAAIDIASFATKQGAARFYFYIVAGGTPSGFAPIFSAHNNGTTDIIALLNISSARRLQLQSKGANTFYPTTIYDEAKWYRVEIEYQVLTTTTGVLNFRTYEGDSTTVKDSFSATTLDMGTTNLGRVRIGKVNASGTLNILIDDIAYDDAKSTPIGPYIAGTASARPISIVDNSGGYTNVGGAASLEAAMADELDTTYIQSPDAPVGSPITAKLDTLLPGDVTIPVRISTSSGTITTKIDILQGTTQIATRTTTATTTVTDYAFTLTSGELALVTDRANLNVRITATAV